jgi:hypothetical protein
VFLSAFCPPNLSELQEEEVDAEDEGFIEVSAVQPEVGEAVSGDGPGPFLDALPN